LAVEQEKVWNAETNRACVLSVRAFEKAKGKNCDPMLFGDMTQIDMIARDALGIVNGKTFERTSKEPTLKSFRTRCGPLYGLGDGNRTETKRDSATDLN